MITTTEVSAWARLQLESFVGIIKVLQVEHHPAPKGRVQMCEVITTTQAK